MNKRLWLKVGLRSAALGLFCVGAVGGGFAQAASVTAPELMPLDKAHAAQLLNATQYKRPTLVVLWSSDCGHCKRNLQWLQARWQQGPQADLITVAVEPQQNGLAGMLGRYALPGRHFVYGPELPEALAYALDPNWAGELPRSYVFNGQGKRVAVSGVLNDKILKAALAP